MNFAPKQYYLGVSAVTSRKEQVNFDVYSIKTEARVTRSATLGEETKTKEATKAEEAKAKEDTKAKEETKSQGEAKSETKSPAKDTPKDPQSDKVKEDPKKKLKKAKSEPTLEPEDELAKLQTEFVEQLQLLKKEIADLTAALQ
jgi:hypothetical protein